jgi:hypothetical protein
MVPGLDAVAVNPYNEIAAPNTPLVTFNPGYRIYAFLET